MEVPSPEQPTVIFDPAKLAAQLSELLELYLARAKEALLEEQMSSREAVACAKQVSGMLEDTQSGKLAKVDTSTPWPRLEFARVGGTGVPPVIRPRPALSRTGGPQVAALQDPPIQSLHDAVTAVCQWDPETAILEPWAQLLVRMNQLTQRLSADIEEWKATCEEPQPISNPNPRTPGFSPAPTVNADERGAPVHRGTADAVPVVPSPENQPAQRPESASKHQPQTSCQPSGAKAPPTGGSSPAGNGRPEVHPPEPKQGRAGSGHT